MDKEREIQKCIYKSGMQRFTSEYECDFECYRLHTCFKQHILNTQSNSKT